MKKRFLLLAILSVMLMITVFSGCDKREDTRKYVHTIGIVITNDVGNVFDELFVYPVPTDGVETKYTADMGPDWIKNTKNSTKIGSYGVTVVESGSYNVWVRDRRGNVYTFDSVSFSNGDHGIITFDELLSLTVYHFGGGTETVAGEYVRPGDAPEHPHRENVKQVTLKFAVENKTGDALVFVSMRESKAQAKGEVELYLDKIAAGKTVNINRKLDERDQEITEWVLNIEVEDGKSVTSDVIFNPWTTEKIIITKTDGAYKFEVS